MKVLIFALGTLAGLAFSRIPHIGPLFRDQPETPADWAPKYELGGRRVTREEFEAHAALPNLSEYLRVTP